MISVNNFSVDGQTIGAGLVAGIVNGLSQLDGAGLGGRFGDGLEKFVKHFELEGAGFHFGENLTKAIHRFSYPVGSELESIAQRASRSWLKISLPTITLTSVVTIGLPLTMNYVYYRALHYLTRPKLAMQMDQRSRFSFLTAPLRMLGSLFYSSKAVKPVFNPSLTKKIDEIQQSLECIEKNKGYFQNLLLYGPGGTGKTMIVQYLATQSEMDYVMMSGGDLAQYIQRGEHVTELNYLIESIQKSPRPTILFIDEAEGLCMNRTSSTSPARLELINAFLNHTGLPNQKFMIILATNRMEDLDDAVLSRMDHKLYIGPPEASERETILKMYIEQFFPGKDALFFDAEKMEYLVQRTEGFTGRQIFKMVNDFLIRKMTTKENQLTDSLIQETVEHFVEQEKEIVRKKGEK